MVMRCNLPVIHLCPKTVSSGSTLCYTHWMYSRYVSICAGSCTHKSESAVKFEGKECKVEKTLGFSKNSTQGGDIDIIPLDWSKLIPVSDDDSSSAIANATATAGK